MITAQEVKFQSIREIANLVRGFVIGRYRESGGMCVEASCYIGKLLRSRGIEFKCYQGAVRYRNTVGWHVWIEVDDVIVDVTADQFNDEVVSFPSVLIGTHIEYPQYQDGKELIFKSDAGLAYKGEDFVAILAGELEPSLT